MEENITKPKNSVVEVIICSPFITNSANLDETLQQFIDPDNKDARKFSYSFVKNPDEIRHGDSSLHVVLAKEIAAIKVSEPFIFLESDGTSVTEQLQDVMLALEGTLDLGFSIKDFAFIYRQGTRVENLRRQLAIFRNGIGKIELSRPATSGDGIFPMPADDVRHYAELFDSKKESIKIKKFVPASGAASRMFKFLSEFCLEFDPEKETINAYINRKKDVEMHLFLVGLSKFPFFKEIMDVMMMHPEYNSWNKTTRVYHFVKTMLTDPKFDYANKPKGILPFHMYPDHLATPVCEHLKEAAAYASSQGRAHVHFTISEEHLDGFLDSVNMAKQQVESATGTTIEFDFSYQHKSTDTIAVDLNNKPFREKDGKLLFRPGGHGALIENLNKLDADVVFVKNIDNVSHNNINAIALYKKSLAGRLLELQEAVFGYLSRLESGSADEGLITEILEYAQTHLSQDIPTDIRKYTLENQVEYVFKMLNRPIRVCGMVKNEGEPGGGPFWVEADRGRVSLQIVESSQVNHDNKEQAALFSNSTHFNPVDLVCALKDFKGNTFNLREYIDHSTGFIVQKNRFGTDVKSYELPGLWNGAMAGWITVFCEVPLETFNPVKTVNDLLKPSHQPN